MLNMNHSIKSSRFFVAGFTCWINMKPIDFPRSGAFDSNQVLLTLFCVVFGVMWPGTVFEPTKILRKSRQNLISVEVGIWLHYYIVYMYVYIYMYICIYVCINCIVYLFILGSRRSGIRSCRSHHHFPTGLSLKYSECLRRLHRVHAMNNWYN